MSTWHVAAGDPTCVFVGTAKPIACGSKERAKLIAAAPDLLAACQKVIAHHSIDLCDCGEPECATTQLRAAINKAL